MLHCQLSSALTHIPTSAVYMRQWTGSALVQIMACRLFGAKSLSKPMLDNWALRNKLPWTFNQNTKLFVYENASEHIVSETAAILCSGRWVLKSQTLPQCIANVGHVHMSYRINVSADGLASNGAKLSIRIMLIVMLHMIFATSLSNMLSLISCQLPKWRYRAVSRTNSRKTYHEIVTVSLCLRD